MGKIHVFGCSIMQQHKMKYLKTDKDILIHAVGGGSNLIQILKYNSLYFNNKIKDDDVIIWQISQPGRWLHTLPWDLEDPMHNHYTKEIMTKANKIKKEERDEKYWGDVSLVNSVIDDSFNIFLTSRNGKAEIEWNYVETQHNDITDTLVTIDSINKNGIKILVLFGWWEVFTQTKNDYMIFDFLDKRNINYIREPITDYAKENGIKLKDRIHPVEEGYKLFTEDLLQPKLKSLNWI